MAINIRIASAFLCTGMSFAAFHTLDPEHRHAPHHPDPRRTRSACRMNWRRST